MTFRFDEGSHVALIMRPATGRAPHTIDGTLHGGPVRDSVFVRVGEPPRVLSARGQFDGDLTLVLPGAGPTIFTRG